MPTMDPEIVLETEVAEFPMFTVWFLILAGILMLADVL